MTDRGTSGGGALALPPTPARERLCGVVAAACDRARSRGLTPKSVYLTPGDFALAGLRAHAGDPPRCLGLPVNALAGKGRSRLYCNFGIALSLPRLDDPTPAQPGVTP